MKIAIIGTNGMLSKALTQLFYANGHSVDVYGLERPVDYPCTAYVPCNLLKDTLHYDEMIKYKAIIYAAGAGVQAALSTPSELMYALNVTAPISITLGLKKAMYNGIFISFGSYMEVGITSHEAHAFTEDEIVCSSYPVTNDYALSKRLFSRYMKDFTAPFTYWHFMLPNMFSNNDMQPGTRLIPYVIQCIQDIRTGKEVHPSFSAGTQIRQFIQLEELFDVITNAYHKQLQSGIYCVGGGEVMSIRSLIQRIFAYYHINCLEEWFGKEARRDNDIPYLALNGDKLHGILSFMPEKQIENLLCSNGLN